MGAVGFNCMASIPCMVFIETVEPGIDDHGPGDVGTLYIAILVTLLMQLPEWYDAYGEYSLWIRYK